MGLICACWIGGYYLRFSEIVEPVTKGVPDLRIYLLLLVPIIAVWGMSFQAFDLYRPRRMGTRVAEFLDVAKANTLSVLILVAVTFFLRAAVRILPIGAALFLATESHRTRFFACPVQRGAPIPPPNMDTTSAMRSIIGASRLGCRVVEALENHPNWVSSVQGFLSADARKRGGTH